jgi:hypothetical protein
VGVSRRKQVQKELQWQPRFMRGIPVDAAGTRASVSEARQLLDELETRPKQRYTSPTYIGVIYAGLGTLTKPSYGSRGPMKKGIRS